MPVTNSKGINEVIKDFYSIGKPSHHLEAINDLVSIFIAEAKNLELTDRYVENIIFEANAIGLFIVKLKEEYDKQK